MASCLAQLKSSASRSSLRSRSARTCVVDTRESVLRRDEAGGEGRVVDVGEQRLVEVRPVAPIEDLVRHPASEQTPNEVSSPDIRELDLGGEAQEELEQVDVGPGPARLHAAYRLADRLGLRRDAQGR